MFVEVLFSFERLEIIFLNCSLKTGYYIKKHDLSVNVAISSVMVERAKRQKIKIRILRS
jgi:hypothetical protein